MPDTPPVRRVHGSSALLTAFLLVLGPAIASAQQPRALRLDAEFVIDGQSNHLHAISSLLMTRDGGVVAISPQDRAVRFFTATGAPSAAVGGRSAPVFRTLVGGGWLGDTLWVADDGTHSTTLIGPDHRVARSELWAPPRPIIQIAADRRAPALDIAPRALYADGTALVATHGVRSTSLAIAPDNTMRSRLIRVGAGHPAQLMVERSLGDANAACITEYRAVGVSASGPVPYCAHPELAIAQDGNRIALLNQTNVGPAHGMFRVTMLGGRGDTLYTQTFRHDGDLISAGARDTAMQRVRRSIRTMPASVTWRDLVSTRPLPHAYEPVGRMLVGTDSTLWIELHVATERRWLVLDANGRPVSCLQTPLGERIESASLNRVWAVRPQPGRSDLVRYGVHPNATNSPNFSPCLER